MYEPHEPGRSGQDRPGYLSPSWTGPGPGPGPDPGGFSDHCAAGPRIDRLPDGDRPRPVRSERDLLLAQGVRIAEELSLMRLLFHTLGRDASVATVEFKINRPW